jgi:hypothetical protein
MLTSRVFFAGHHIVGPGYYCRQVVFAIGAFYADQFGFGKCIFFYRAFAHTAKLPHRFPILIKTE